MTIGFYTSFSAGNLSATLVEYSRRFPQVDISTVEGSRARLFEGIRTAKSTSPSSPASRHSDCNRSMVLWSERIIVALPEDHPLAANEIIYWTDLKRERFLLERARSRPGDPGYPRCQAQLRPAICLRSFGTM